MKIKDFSEEKQLTRQAVYKALNRAGYSARNLTDKNGNITKKGLSVLNQLFPSAGESDSSEPEQPEHEKPVLQDQVKQLETVIQDLKSQIDELKQKCSEWEKRYFEQVEHSKTETEQLRILLAKEQELRLLSENKGFFKRLFAGRKGKENDHD